ncbi:MAG: hypothetical protein IPO90_03075 [Flavobacteriales bacterium]|nr:hypothetical protein [Flavobacteriales bacterium]
MLTAYMQSSSVLAHELGHAFNLYHTFEGDVNGTACPPNSNCGTDGDQVCDIPPHIRPSSCNPGRYQFMRWRLVAKPAHLQLHELQLLRGEHVHHRAAHPRPVGHDQPARFVLGGQRQPFPGATERAAAGLPRFRRRVVRHRPNGNHGRPVPLPAEHLLERR